MLDFAHLVHYNRQADKLIRSSWANTWRCRVVGRARTIGNRVRVKSSSRVRISPSPPWKHIPCRKVGDVFFIKHGEIRIMSEHAGGMFIDQFKNWSILLSDFPVSRKGKSDASESLHLRHKRQVILIEIACLFLFVLCYDRWESKRFPHPTESMISGLEQEVA